uniref:Uncharacterized protein n=1 Tax=Panagrolaimus davidi TaxID=227884 RepID=A0A914Q7U8_9BILA
MKLIFFITFIIFFAATINANHIRAQRSVSSFGSYSSSSTGNGHVVTHGNNHLTTANHGHVGTVGNVHNSAVGPHSAHHNSVTNVANSGRAGAHSSVAAVNTHHVYH